MIYGNIYRAFPTGSSMWVLHEMYERILPSKRGQITQVGNEDMSVVLLYGRLVDYVRCICAVLPGLEANQMYGRSADSEWFLGQPFPHNSILAGD